MPDAVTHPTTQELAAFGLGKLPQHAAAAVAAHLEACAACRQAVADVPADSFLAKVRAVKPGSSSLPPGGLDATASFIDRPEPSPAPLKDVPPELAQHPKYQILRELGRGGMGVVYQARQTTMMNRQVVIKVVNRALLEQPGALERFRREIAAAAQLSHPNIVTAYDAEQAGDLHMLVMEFVPGQSLAEVLEKKGPLSIARACHYMRQVALGLQHASDRGMVHRDIKPGNLMLMPKGQVKILDFGLAKIASERRTSKGITSSDAYMGTPDFCAPEQATDARSADIRADLYSLGCTLYCLLAGCTPFQEDTAMKTILAHLEKKPQPLPQLRPEVPEALWRVVARLLAKDPAHRYQKPIDIVHALAPFAKVAAKPEARTVTAPAPRAASVDKATKIGVDTSQVKKILRYARGEAPPKPPPAAEQKSPFADLREPARPKATAGGRDESAAPILSPRYRRPRTLAAIGAFAVAVLGLGLLGWVIIRDKNGKELLRVHTPDGSTVEIRPDAPPEAKHGNGPTGGRDQDGPSVSKSGPNGTAAPVLDGDKEPNRPGQAVSPENPKPRKSVEGDQPDGPPAPKARPARPAGSDDAPGAVAKPTLAAAPFGAAKARELQLAWAKFLNKPVHEEVDLGEGVKMSLVLVPPGRFQMGSPDNEQGRGDGEYQHTVEITKPFYIGRFAVTRGQFRRFAKDEHYETEADSDPEPRHTWKAPGYPQTDEHPAVVISWNDANAFCTWLSRRTGRTFRLPTEAEWEYSCRAGTTTRFYAGGRDEDLRQIANIADLSLKAKWDYSGLAEFNKRPLDDWFDRDVWNDGYPFTAAVGSFRPNAFGLYDMLGNVLQWCQDVYDNDYYKNSPERDPRGPPHGGADLLRVLRGGNCYRVPDLCRAAMRARQKPSLRGGGVGFRVVLAVGGPEDNTSSRPAVPSLADPRRKDLDRAKAAYERAIAQVDRKLLADFAKALRAVRQHLKGEPLHQAIRNLNREKEAFVQNQTMPWPPRMRAAAIEYLHGLRTARNTLRQAFVHAREHYEKASASAEADALTVEMNTALRPRVAGAWDCTGRQGLQWRLTLYTDFSADGHGAHHWELHLRSMAISAITPGAPRGLIDICAVAKDGASFATGDPKQGRYYAAKLAR